jgi:hypothetical protein
MEKITNSKIEQIKKPSEHQINEIIRINSIEKLKSCIEDNEKNKTEYFENESLKSQFKEIIENYKPETILKSLFSFFNMKKKEINKEREEEGRSNRFGFGRSRFGDRNNFRRGDSNPFFKRRKNFNY